MADTNIQFYTDTRTVKTSDDTSKVAIGSANGTTQGFEIAYDLLTTQKAFKISPLGVNYTSGITNDTTSLPRIAQVGTLLQSVDVPPNATTLEVNKTLLLTDTVSTGSIGIVGTTTQIYASGDLVLNPVGSISANGKTLDMTNGEIHKCPLIHGPNNTDMYVEAKGTGDLILETNGINRLTIADTGIMTFEGGMSYNNTTNTLTATNFTGLASNATNSSFSNNILTTEDNSSTLCYPIFVKSSGSGQKNAFIDSSAGPFTIIPSTGEMKLGTTVKIEGSGGNQKIALGVNAGSTGTGSNTIGIGLTAGQLLQNNNGIAIGNAAGNNGQKGGAVAIGTSAGLTTQGTNSIAIGNTAGTTTQGDVSIAIGQNAGQWSQGGSAVAIGNSAGVGTTGSGQGSSAVAIGNSTGQFTQGNNAIAIGNNAGNSGQGQHAVAIGNNAAILGQGNNCVAIGRLAGSGGMVDTSIAINGSGVALPAANAGLYINPIRNGSAGSSFTPALPANVLYYNPATSEVLKTI